MKKGTSNYDLQVDMAKGIFLNYDQEDIIRKFSLEAEEAWICLTYLNIPFRISRTTGGIEECHGGQLRPAVPPPRHQSSDPAGSMVHRGHLYYHRSFRHRHFYGQACLLLQRPHGSAESRMRKAGRHPAAPDGRGRCDLQNPRDPFLPGAAAVLGGR